MIDDGLEINKGPDVLVERSEFLLHFQKALGIVHTGRYLQAVADNAFVLQQLLQFSVVVCRYFHRIKIVVRLSIVFTLA